MKKIYRVVKDLQGGDFAMGIYQSVEDWRQQALNWAFSDGNDAIYNELRDIDEKDVMDYIAEFWTLEFEELDVYSRNYDYDDIKIAVVIAETFKDWCVICDYEYIATLIIKIKDKWKEYQPHGWLTEEEFAYMQKWAVNYLNENKNEIIGELR